MTTPTKNIVWCCICSVAYGYGPSRGWWGRLTLNLKIPYRPKTFPRCCIVVDRGAANSLVLKFKPSLPNKSIAIGSKYTLSEAWSGVYQNDSRHDALDGV